MGRGLGAAFSALGSGLTAWGTDLRERQAADKERDARLALSGLYRRPPKTAMPAGTGEMEAVAMPASPAMQPGMRLPPVTQMLGLDPDFGGGQGSVAAPPNAAPAPVTTESLSRLRDALRSTKAEEAPDVTTLFGNQYEYRPEATPEGRRAAMQGALKERQDRAAYLAYRQSGGTEPFDAGSGQWAEINAGRIRNTTTHPPPDPDEQRRYFAEVNRLSGGRLQYIDGNDYKAAYNAAIGRENAQTNQREIRIEFPPQRGGGSDGTTATQERAIARQQAEAQMRARVRTVGGAGIVPEDYHRISAQSGGVVSQAELMQIAADEHRKMEDLGEAGNSTVMPTIRSHRP